MARNLRRQQAVLMPANTITTKLALAAATVAAIATFAPASASAAGVTRYVTPDGEQSGSCLTPETACAIVRGVQNAALAGDTVLVGPGTYTLTSTLYTGADDVTVQGLPGARPVINFPDTLKAANGVATYQHGLTLRHLRVQAAGKAMTAISGDGLTLDDVDVRTPGDFADGVVSTSTAAITNSTIWSPGTEGDPVAVKGGISSLRHVTTWGGATGLTVTNGQSQIAVATVHDSILHGEVNDICLYTGNDISHTAAVNIDHSVFRSYKVFKSNQFGYLNDKGSNIADAPLLADTTTGDLHQLAGSPTIDKGSQEAGDGTTDIDGQDRVQGSQTDMGADEYKPTTALADPPAAPAEPTTGSSSTASASAPTAPADTGAVAPAAAAAKAPVLGSLWMTPARFRVASGKAARTGGTRVAYMDSAAATTKFTVQRRTVRVRRGHRSISWTAVRGSLTHGDHAGANTFTFSGKWGGHALKPGQYRLSAVARDSAGRASAPKTKAFRVTR